MRAFSSELPSTAILIYRRPLLGYAAAVMVMAVPSMVLSALGSGRKRSHSAHPATQHSPSWPP